MIEKEPLSKKKISADWLFRGVLTKVGDTFDRFTGRRWIASSSLATSEIIERLKKLLDSEAKDVPGKGLVVPHNIKLKMQWDKFSDDSDAAINLLRNELMTAAVDHINDSLYYTYAPISLEVKTDYFTEGVKLLVSFDKFDEEDRDVEINVAPSAVGITDQPGPAADPSVETYVARYELAGVTKERRLTAPVNGRISVGRTGENALPLDDPSVSKMHASLMVGPEGGLAVADTGSTNGTFINGQRIAYGKAMAVTGNDKIKFGTLEVVFEHVPRPVIAGEPEAAVIPPDGSVEIDGFEFKRRVTTETVPDVAAQPEYLTENIAGHEQEQLAKTVATDVSEIEKRVSDVTESKD